MLKGVNEMGSIVERAIYSIFGNIILALVIIPISIIFLAYLIYIVVMTIKELKK